MAKQAPSQKIGSIGHRWVMLEIEEHPAWLSRDLSDDFGVDAEAELNEFGVNGEIIKLQFKSSKSVERRAGKVKFSVDRKYLSYASICRYPVIFVVIDIETHQAWYLWLQDWLLDRRRIGDQLKSDQQTFTVWVKSSQTLTSGLNGELKEIARWRGDTQLVLSLLDAMRAGIAKQSSEISSQIVDLILSVAPDIADATLDIVLEEAIIIGDRMLGTLEGVNVSQQLFKLVREFGGKASASTIERMVRRENSYSRTGLTALGIMYDNFFEHTKSLSLTKLFLEHDLPNVAYYCALRESFPNKKYADFFFGPGDFSFAGLAFESPNDSNFSGKYANRGPSAILDFLVPLEWLKAN